MIRATVEYEGSSFIEVGSDVEIPPRAVAAFQRHEDGTVLICTVSGMIARTTARVSNVRLLVDGGEV